MDLVLAIAILSYASADAATLGEFKPDQAYSINQIEFAGTHAFSAAELRNQMSTKERPFYQIWKKPPLFDPQVFAIDLERLQRFYQAHGYYRVKIDYELQVHESAVTADIRVGEGPPTRVRRLSIECHGSGPSGDLYQQIALKRGAVFNEPDYQKSEDDLAAFFRNAGYAHVKVTRMAQIDPARDAARVWYAIEPGGKAVFGATTVTGTQQVDPKIVLRELTYKPGEQFSQHKLEETKKRILALGLFGVVRFELQLHTDDPRVVPITLVVKEKPKHLIRIGGGYNTESQFIADFQWSDMNWLGDGRQLSVLLGYSNINSTAAIVLKQPFLLEHPELTATLSLREDVQQVPTYTLFGSRLVPRLEYRFSPALMVYLGYQLEYDSLSAIDPTVFLALGNFRQSGVLSGPNAGLVLNTTDDPMNPKHGYKLTLDAMGGGGPFGGAFGFYRAVAEVRHYQLTLFNTVLATRLKLGLADATGSKLDYPLFYRFYSGGEGSVRGYGYWRLGPKSLDNVPLGGLSQIEGSIEVRHALWKQLSGALFLDFGQLSTHPYDIPINHLDFGAGPAVSYNTPIGPLRLDLGIPFEKPHGDQAWQVYFSIGQYF